MENIICPDCGEKQWSIADKNYVNIYKTCFNCDQKRWVKGKLSEQEFDKRYEIACKTEKIF